MAGFDPFSCVNGRVDGALSLLDRGLAYGDGLFETMRLEGGRLPFWSFHRQRLLSGCNRLQISLDERELEACVAGMLARACQRGTAKGVFKVVASRGTGGRGYQPLHTMAPTVVTSVFPFPAHPRSYVEDGVKVYVCAHRLPDNSALAGIKHLNKLDYVLAALEWRDSGCQEALLFDSRDCLVEASGRNVFVKKDGVLLTPSVEQAGVAGILRKRIVDDYAKTLDMCVEEAPLTLDDLKAADEIFLGNSVFGVWPVKSLVGKGIPEFTVARLECGGDTVARKVHRLFEDDIRTRIE